MSSQRTPRQIGRLLTDNLLDRPGILTYKAVNAAEIIRQKDLLINPYMHYSEVCTASGALVHARLTGNRPLAAQIAERYQPLLESSGSSLLPARYHVDDFVFGVLAFELGRHTADPRWLEIGRNYADRQWESPTEEGLTSQSRWWIDDTFMVGALQAQAYHTLGAQKYADRAAAQISAYISRLQQPNGLFFHGPQAQFFWGRGNGWVASGITRTLGTLGSSHPLRPGILKAYQLMMAALLQHQAPDGMWRQLVDHPDFWVETSCSAMFATAIVTGVTRGWLDRTTYLPAAERAWTALGAYISPTGDVGNICVGTDKSTDREYYRNRPQHAADFHGQGPMLWLANALTELGNATVATGSTSA